MDQGLRSTNLQFNGVGNVIQSLLKVVLLEKHVHQSYIFGGRKEKT